MDTRGRFRRKKPHVTCQLTIEMLSGVPALLPAILPEMAKKGLTYYLKVVQIEGFSIKGLVAGSG